MKFYFQSIKTQNIVSIRNVENDATNKKKMHVLGPFSPYDHINISMQTMREQ